MAKPLRPKRGTTAKNDAFTGLASEITIDTDKHSIRVHDGVTPGGYETLMTDGGTMTGAIYGSGGMVRGKTDDGDVWISGGTNSAANPYIQLNGGSKSSNAGVIEVVAKDTTNSSSLRMKPDGMLTWGGKNVITSAGGTMTGSLVLDGTDIKASNDSAVIAFRGGTGFQKGSQINLYGKDHADKAGWVEIYSSDGTTTKTAIIKPDGTFTWDGKNIPHVKDGNLIGASVVYKANFDVDLNTIQETGLYSVVATDGTKAQSLNYPADGGMNGFLEVFANESGHIRQNYYRIGTTNSNDHNVFTRTISAADEGGTWYRIITNKDNIVRSVNGTSADASGNVTLSVSSGTVTKKFESGKKTIGSNSSATVSITGLTANKPLYLICKANVDTYVGITSGAVYVNNTTTQGILSSWGNDPGTAVIIPTGTSVGLKLRNNSEESSTTAYLIAYQ